MKPLLKLLADNRGIGYFKAEKQGDEATLYIYDAIVSDDYWGGVSATAFVKALSAIDAKTIHLRINSPGGDVFAARAMEQAIREHPANIIAHIDGYAASAASYVALAADEVVMAQGAFYMIHKAWTIAYGNADDLMATADLLEKVDGTLIATYAKETGQEAQQIADWMTAETWFTADEAIAAGFADRLAEDAPKAKAAWNLAAYAHAPQLAQPEPEPEESAAPPAPTFTNTDHLRRKLALIERT